MSCAHVVFMNFLGTGHINPTLPIVAELNERGCTVSYFVDACMRDVVESAGATWYPLKYPHSNETGPLKTLNGAGIAKYVPRGTAPEAYEALPHSLVYTADLVLPALIEDLQLMNPAPSIIVYDPFLVYPRVAAHVLKIPAISTLTMPGPGALVKNETVIATWESKPWVIGPRSNILERYGFDVLQDNLQMECYSPVLNLVTTIQDFFVPPPDGTQRARYGGFPFLCVGSLVDSKVKRVANVELKFGETDAANGSLLQQIDAARMAGRQIVYVSMGTVATGKYWNKPFGPFGKGNGLEECNGKTLIQHVFKAVFDVIGHKDEVLVVMATGSQPKEDVFDAMPQLPSNVLVRSSVPQLEVLRRCDVFITHGGANSMHEALSSRVPMLVIPAFGDQPANADTIADFGAGISFRNPLTSVTASALRAAIDSLTTPDLSQSNKFRLAATRLSEKLSAAGGVHAAVDAIIQHAVLAPPSNLQDSLLQRQHQSRDVIEESDAAEVPKTQSCTLTAMTGRAMNRAGA